MSATIHSQLGDLRQIAYSLGMAFGAEAKCAETPERRMEFFHLFDRCFFSVRVSIALELRLRREATQPILERETESPESPERELAERPERYDERDRERDQDREPASLPVLLRTLNQVAADASALPGPPPAELPTLRELLARVTSQPAPTSAPSALRARLTGSATAPALVLPPTSRPGVRAVLPVRRATGPPRR